MVLLIQVFRNNKIYNIVPINYCNIVYVNGLMVLVRQDCLLKKMIGPKMTMCRNLQFIQRKGYNGETVLK